MTTILVVDDSKTDRRFVGGILEKEHDWKVTYADNGADAVAQMKESPADVVITDLQMPEMDGFELVASLKRTNPHTPVIIMTSEGSEDVAIKALSAGAASYAPKRSLAKELRKTVLSVLAASGELRSTERLMECMSETDTLFTLPTDHSLIPPLVNFIQDRLFRVGVCDDSDRIRVGIAVEEALSNALYHGNLELSSELREEDDDAYREEVARRLKTEPYRSRRMFVRVSIKQDEGVITIRDEGHGFDPQEIPDPRNPAILDKVCGRGLLLIRTFMDEISHNATGSEITMVKRKSVPQGDAA